MDIKFLRTENYSRDKVIRGRRLLEKNKGKTSKFLERLYSKRKQRKMISEIKYIKKDNITFKLPSGSAQQKNYMILDINNFGF